MITYRLNGIDITPHVIESSRIVYRVGKTQNLTPGQGTIKVANNTFLFSPENEDSFLYQFRNDYAQCTVEIYDDNEVCIWRGVIDNVERDADMETATITSTEKLINLLDVASCEYQSGDGYIGDQVYHGEDAPAAHMLAFIRRYFDDDEIDVPSFVALAEYQTGVSITVECQVTPADNIKPIDFLKSLCLDMAGLYTYNNKLYVERFQPFKGNYGYMIPESMIINKGTIRKENITINTKYSIAYDGGSTSGTIGASGTGTATSSTLTDGTATWEYNELVDQYIEINNAIVLKIIENTPTVVRFAGNTETGAGLDYKILKTNNLYSKDYSAFPIKLKGGADALGVAVLDYQKAQKITLDNMDVADSILLKPGDLITINWDDEGLIMRPFEITNIEHVAEEKLYRISALDITLFDGTETLSPPDAPQNLTGWRNGPNEAILDWDLVADAVYYRIYYSTNQNSFPFIQISTSSDDTIEDLFPWANYWFFVTAVNGYGMESGPSNILPLPAIQQEAGYIDGTDGPNIEQYSNWGNLEAYHFLICYKNLIGGDIRYLAKTPLAILDKSQDQGADDVADTWVSESLNRTLGYMDTAGISNFNPYYKLTGAVVSVINSLSKSLTLAGTTYAAGADITGSDSWFIKDAAGNYMNYWYGSGYMADILNTGWRAWFKAYHIDRCMGIFDTGTGTGAGTITDLTKSWNVNQWAGYYCYFPDSTLDSKFVPILSNTANTLTIDNDTQLTGEKYIISAEPYIGFKGVFLDDVWDNIYDNLVLKSDTDGNTTCDWAGATWVTDSTKTWTANEWAGYKVRIGGAGSWFTITDNTADTINFDGPNGNVGAGKSYEIKCKFEVDNGMTYAQAMADFLAEIREHIELRSLQYEGSTARLAQGIICLNTWPDDFANYAEYINAINLNYMHFAMFEALQCTWIVENEVTRQFKVNDWHHALTRYNSMKLVNVRLATLGYPPHQQMYLAHLAAGMILSKYSDKIEDIISASNIILSQLYYDMLMARGYIYNYTVGIPEDDYTAANYDRYAIHWREFEGCFLYFNPSRKIRKISIIPSEDLTSYHSGDVSTSGASKDLYLPGWAMECLFKADGIGNVPSAFLQTFKPYTYVDCNAAWIVFTAAGAAAIGTDSVWINNGHGHHRKFVLDGSASVPDGTPSKLFHAGDGASTITGHDPQTENITGETYHGRVTLTSKTVYAIAKITHAGGTLTPGTDYYIDFNESKNNAVDRGTWDTEIIFITDWDTVALTVYYYEQGLDGGYPDAEYTRIEHGILYREATGFELVTGGIDYADCSTALVEGTDYYVIPELIRWKWDYRIKPYYGALSGTVSYNTRDAVTDEADGVQKIQWGDVDPDNAILIDKSVDGPGSMNGKKVSYTTKTITRPKVIIYGFSKTPRSGSYATIAIAARVYSKWRTENIIAGDNGILYDDVVITGDYDGIEDPEAAGAWGSIDGWLNAESKTVAEAQAYFDAVIICDNFLEASASSPSTKDQWSSWLNENDYLFLKGFKSTGDQNKLIVDIRFGATAFVWWGGHVAIQDCLLNKGADLDDDGEDEESDLTDIYGRLYFASCSYSDLYDADSEIYTDEAGTKLTSSAQTDMRICAQVDRVTDHYDVDLENNVLPFYNVNENGGPNFSFVPQSPYRATITPAPLLEKSKLYVKYNDFTNPSAIETYEQLGLDNLILRKEQAILWHRVYFDQTTIGGVIYATTWATFVNFGITYLSSDMVLDSFTGKYFRYPEAFGESENRIEIGSVLWQGYRGHYIDSKESYSWDLTNPQVALGNGFETGIGWEWEDWWGGLSPVEGWMFYPFGNVLFPIHAFTSWCADISDHYDISKKRGGQIEFEKSYNPITRIMGTITGWQKITDNVRITVDKDISKVTPISFLASVVITRASYYPIINVTYLYDADDVLINYVGSFISIDGKYHKLKGRYGYVYIDGHYDDIEVDISYNIYQSSSTWRICIAQTGDVDNTIWDGIIVAKNETLKSLDVQLPRNATEITFGYFIAYKSNEETLDNNKTTGIGGLFTTIELANKFYPEAAMEQGAMWTADTLDLMTIAEKPFGLKYYEHAYANYLYDFAMEYTTGLIVGYCYQRMANKAPCVVWSGAGPDDIKRLILNFIGSKIEWTGVEVADANNLYLYFNQMTDMLNIYEDDVENPVTCPFSYGAFLGSHICNLIARQDLDIFILDSSEMNSEDTLT